MNAPDPQAFKAAMRDQWDRSAQGWNDHAAPIGVVAGPRHRCHARDGRRTPRRAGSRRGRRRRRADTDHRRARRPFGFVLATDLSPAIVALAQANALRAGHGQVRVQVADGENLSASSRRALTRRSAGSA